MAVRVTPTEANPTHMVSLSDGTTTIGLNLCDGKGTITPLGLRQSGVPRTSLQIRQGDADYSSYELPYTTITQKDWSGGRALEDFTKDGTRFYDSNNVDTRGGDAILGPLSTIETGITKTFSTSGTSEVTLELLGTYNKCAFSYVPSVTVTLKSIEFQAYASSLTDSLYKLGIFDDAAGSPGTELSSIAFHYPTQINTWETVTDYITQEMTAGTKYWVVFSIRAAMTGTIKFRYGSNTSSNVLADNGSWVSLATNSGITSTMKFLGGGTAIMFEYKYSLFAVTRGDDGSRPRLFRNGYRGTALSNATDKTKLNTSLSLTGINLAGKIAMVWSGPGSEESQNWRTISSNTTTGTNDVITVSPAWNTAHTTSTLFVILGCDAWVEMTTTSGSGTATTIKSLSTYLTKPVTDVLVVNDIIYLAQGTSDSICRLNLASTELWNDADEDGTNTADFMLYLPNSETVWTFLAATAKANVSPVKTWGNDLVPVGDITCGNPRTRITGVEAYGTPQIPYVFKEEELGSIEPNSGATDGTWASVNLREMGAVRDTFNGRAHCQFGVYLFFSLLQGMERFYENRLDDIGPNLEEGLPTTRQGYITKLLPYPGGIFAAVDAGSSGYSSILFWNQLGWHEIFRSSTIGSRITWLFVQVMPGTMVDRLWFSENEDIYWVPVCLNPRKQSDYTYTTTGHVITAWISGGFKEITKFWKSVTLFTEGLSANVNIAVSYQTDSATDASAWTALPTTFTTSPVQEVLVATLNNVSGKRIRFKLTFTTNSSSSTPRLKAMTVDSVTRLPVKRAWTITFRADDSMRDLATGESETLTAAGLISQCATWASSTTRATPITFRNIWPTFDNNSVFIDPLSITPSSIQVNQGGIRREVQICTMTMYEA